MMQSTALVGVFLLAVFQAAGPATAGGGETPSSETPRASAKDTWARIRGTVGDVTAHAFSLDSGKGTILVEMDSGDRDADRYELLPGDEVTVDGRIDDDYETTKIEASSVYVEKLGTYLFAGPIDDEEDDLSRSVPAPLVISSTVVQGRVTDVGDDGFTVDTGLRKLTVEVDGMSNDPLDEQGYLKIRKGDRVRVTGHMDTDFFEGRELEASSVVKLVG